VYSVPSGLADLVVEPATVLLRELRQRNIEVAICRIEDELTEEDVKAQIL
jgi:hypothetical protein